MRMSQARLSLLFSLMIIVACGLYYSSFLDEGYLQKYDEYFTLERTLGIIKSGDWLTINYNSNADFSKPPLQYWLGAIAIRSGVDQLISLRLWPFVFAIGILITTGLLAFAIAPDRPYVVPLSILFCSSSFLLWDHAISAMLDTGACFFITLTMASMIIGMRDPRLLLLAGFAAGMGFLQKTPAAYLLLILITLLTFRYRQLKYSDPKADNIHRYYYSALFIASILIIGWILLQVSQFGYGYIEKAFLDEIWERFSPFSHSNAFSRNLDEPFIWLRWLRIDAWSIWIPAVIAMPALYVFPSLRRNYRIHFITVIVLVYLVLLTFAQGKVYPRYLLQIMPLLAIILALLIVQMGKKVTFILLLALPLVAFSGGPFHDMYRLYRTDIKIHMETLKAMRGHIPKDKSVIYYNSKYDPDLAPLPPPAVVHSLNLGRYIHIVNNPIEANGLIKYPHLGITTTLGYKDIHEAYKTAKIVLSQNDYVMWVVQ